MNDLALAEQMEELISAEDFLEFFGVDHDPKRVNINRLHILQRFHDYLDQSKTEMPDTKNEKAMFNFYKILLSRAYQDFVDSDAATEKVFKVFQQKETQTTFVSADQLMD